MSNESNDLPKQQNSAKGRESFDVTIDGELVHFFNKSSVAYPTDVSAPKFDLIPVSKQKDIMINVARLHAQQEYDRIMQLVKVLQQQANQIQRRLYVTDQVHGAHYEFQLYHGKCYWLAYDNEKKKTILCHHGPTEWFTGKPLNYEYIARVKWLGDYSWIEVDDNDNPI